MPIQEFGDRYFSATPKYADKKPRTSGKSTTTGTKTNRTPGRKKVNRTQGRGPVLPVFGERYDLAHGIVEDATPSYVPGESNPFGWTDREYALNQGFNQNMGISPTSEDLLASYWQWKQDQYHANGPQGITYDFGDPLGPPKPPGYTGQSTYTQPGRPFYPYQPSGGGGYTFPTYGPSQATGFKPRDPKRGWVQKVLNWRISE